MIRRHLGVALLVLLIAGCAPAFAPGSTTTPPSPTFVPTLAPRVPVQHDMRGVPGCDLLTDEQKLSFGIDLSTEQQNATPSGCTWRRTDPLGVLGAGGVQEPPSGLEGLYRLREVFKRFEPDEIAGYPVVYADFIDDDGRSCSVQIGIADDQMLLAQASYALGPPIGCETARAMAEAMIANLPPPR